MRWSPKQYADYLRKQGKSLTPVESRVLEESKPQYTLFRLLDEQWPGRFISEVSRLIPKRKYRADIVDMHTPTVIELDGFSHHSKYKKDFYRDRERDFWFAYHGWTTLRIPAGLVIKNPEQAVSRVRMFLEAQESRLATQHPRLTVLLLNGLVVRPCGAEQRTYIRT